MTRRWPLAAGGFMLMMRDGVSDMHCMSDTCLTDELEMEYTRMQNTDWSMAIILAMKL